MQYKLQKDVKGEVCAVTIIGQQISIPFDPANTDAQAFAKWLKDGGTPESAEEGGFVSAEWVAETIAKLLLDEGTQ